MKKERNTPDWSKDTSTLQTLVPTQHYMPTHLTPRGTMSDDILHEFILLHQHHEFPRSVTDQLLLDMYHLLSAEHQAELDIHLVRLMASINVTVSASWWRKNPHEDLYQEQPEDLPDLYQERSEDGRWDGFERWA